MKTVKPENDVEQRWEYGIWLGTIEHTSEHIIGTKDGVIKCRAISPLCNGNNFDLKTFDEFQGSPWRPSPRHNSWKLRTNLEGGGEDCEPQAQDFKVQADIGEDPDEARRISEESRRLINSGERGGVKGFFITQTDIARYGTTPGCEGCKFATGRVTYQRGHSTQCRLRIIGMMKEDPEDSRRVDK